VTERIEYDVVLVGAGPANLALAHRLVQLADKPIKIAALEKAKEIGGHLLSGAASNPRALEKLFPDWRTSGFPHKGIVKESYLSVLGSRRWENVPSLLTPPYFNKEGYAILSISEMAAYIATKTTEAAAAKPGVFVDLYPGFPAQEIVYDGARVAGVRVDNTGDANTDTLYGKVTVFGDKGFVSRGLIAKFNLRKNPQIWSVGVKEIWETPQSHEGKVWHTFGYPLPPGHLGGGFIYGQKDNRLVIGMAMGLDFINPNMRPPQVLQDLKKHPYVQEMIRGGRLIKYGASVIPEGGFYSLPEKFAVDGALLVGDALGVLDVKRFSGVDKGMESGIIAAETIWEAFKKDDFSAGRLADFQARLMSGWVGDEMRDSRYFRKAFNDYPGLLDTFIPRVAAGVNSGKSVVFAGFQAGMADPFGSLGLLGARKMIENPSDMGAAVYTEDRTHIGKDYTDTREISQGYVEGTVYTTADVVFYAHTHYGEENRHIEEFSASICQKCIAEFDAAKKDTPCVGDCTAEVHQTLAKDGKRIHAMALENCVQCTTCEIVCPKSNLRVRAALRGYGPDFGGM
jgi:electron-transferring-flavoprotein dehydrogenase